MKYAFVIESGANNLSGYVPDVPGCIATGQSVDEVCQRLQEALELHVEGMVEDGLPLPTATTVCGYVEASLPHES